MDDGAGDHFCYITHTNYVNRSHRMKMVKDSMGLETALTPCTYISETGCTMKELMKEHQGDC